MAAPSERLPWLHDEPPPAAVAPARKKRSGSMWPWYLLLLLLIAAVAAGGWWISTGKKAPPPQLPVEESLPIPVTPVTSEQPGPEQAIDNLAEPAPRAPQPSSEPAPSAPVVRSERRAEAEPLPPPVEEVTAEARRSIFPADEAVPAPPPTGPAPVVVTNPRPYRGRVVQLGAFATRAQAEDNWKRITRRYPYLATKPKMVNTVDVRGLGGGRPTRMYRLQLGTSSQAQSVVICQQLERAGHSCVVVY
jgi:hypothetical protein